ncbi:MAG: flagellar export protein FliJ [Sporolactobacillus sp.]
MVFDFRLERVMAVVKSEKDKLEADYQAHYLVLEDMAHQIVDLMEKKKQTQLILQGQMNQSITIDEMKGYLVDVDVCEKLITQKTVDYSRLKQQLERMKPVLREKAIDLKKYEKLRAKEKQVYDSQSKKKEMKLMDEIAGLRVVTDG